eukprot:scaffold277083_cov28-Tisochrysis_lutea.AAC.4
MLLCGKASLPVRGASDSPSRRCLPRRVMMARVERSCRREECSTRRAHFRKARASDTPGRKAKRVGRSDHRSAAPKVCSSFQNVRLWSADEGQ